MSEMQIRGTQVKDGVIRPDGSQAFTADQSMGVHKLTNVADPASAQDAATKAYVDAVSQGLSFKGAVRAATTGNITLSGAQTIDGVSILAGDRVLVQSQTTGADNGIYDCASGAWTRSADANISAEVKAGMFCFVNEGTANGDKGFVLTTNDPITLGVTALVFVQFSGGSSATAMNASVYRATNQTLTHNTEAALSLSNADYDTSSFWAGGSPTRLTCPTGGTGVHKVRGSVKFAAGFQGSVHLRIYKNGALYTEETSQGVDDAAAEYHQVSADVPLVPTDYVEVKVLIFLPAGSGTADTVGGTGNTFIQIALLSPQAGVASSGKVAQVVNTETGAVATGTTVIPFDDTIPQNTEGDQYMTLAITPTSATNKLKIQVTLFATVTGTTWIIAALFQDSTASALAATAAFSSTSTAGTTITFTHYMTAGTTSATTFKVRIGPNASATISFNGQSGGRIFGGVMASSITIEEIVP